MIDRLSMQFAWLALSTTSSMTSPSPTSIVTETLNGSIQGFVLFNIFSANFFSILVKITIRSRRLCDVYRHCLRWASFGPCAKNRETVRQWVMNPNKSNDALFLFSRNTVRIISLVGIFMVYYLVGFVEETYRKKSWYSPQFWPPEHYIKGFFLYFFPLLNISFQTLDERPRQQHLK